MNKDKILLQLFEREENQQVLVDQAGLSLEAVETASYQRWCMAKRDFIVDDVISNHWIKSCTAGYITEVVFHPDGTLDEYRLFDRFHTHGEWQLDQGLLVVRITKGDNIYSFSVVGNRDVNIHSAVEHKNGELHSYLKLAQIK